MPVALVTAANSRALDEDLPLFAAALADVGVESVPVEWDDTSADWGSYEVAVVRSTWDYPGRRDEFVAWAERAEAATTLLNPAGVLRWNTDKRYLAELGGLGVPVVPTVFFAPGDTPVLPVSGDCVVKPAISAGARDTTRYAADDIAAAAAHVARLQAAGRVAMVQPYVSGVDSSGEAALVFVDGELSHGLRKAPILAGAVEMADGGVYAIETLHLRAPTAAELRVAEATLAAAATLLGLDGPLLYARVDLVPGPAGEPLLLELEVTEPSLFHAYAEGSAARFATAIARRLA